MEKVFKILVVFGLLMIVIIYSMSAREKKFREYYFSRRIMAPQQEGEQEMLTVLVDRVAPRAAKDMENQLFFQPGERSVQVIDDLSGQLVATIGLERDPHGLLFDGAARLLFACSMEGTLTIIRQSERDVYKIVQHLSVPQDVSVLMMDRRSAAIYLQTGEGIHVYVNA